MNERLKSEPAEQEPVSPLSAVLIVFGLLSCCLMPTILGLLSLLGGWLTALPAFDAYRSSLLVPITAILFFVWRRLYRPAKACGLDEGCTSQPKSGLFYKVIFWIVTLGFFNILAYPSLVNIFP